MNAVDDAVNRGREDLARLVAIPSVSAEGRCLNEAATLVRDLLDDAGFATEIHPGSVGPFVVGTVGEGPLTVVIYNHSDVQPEGDETLWLSPPYTLTERDGRLYGRGAADDKGEFASRLAGWRRFRAQQDGPLPFRLIWIVDSEEEIGSPSLDGFLAKRFAGERADLCWWEFGEIDASGRPVILCGFKGITAIELRCRTARGDLHSSYGAVYDNALWRICAAVASMRDAAGRITIDGFYDDVRTPSVAERTAALPPPFSLASVSAATGGERTLNGIDDQNFFSAMNFAPCLNVNGIGGGYQGEGAKTVLPAEAFAKLDFRLVPDQTPTRVVELVRDHLERIGMADIEVIVHDAIVRPVRSDAGHWFVAACAEILEAEFGRPAIVQPSSPASGTAHPFIDHLGTDVFGIGLTHHGAQLHAPNENIEIDHFERMVSASAAIFKMLARRAKSDQGTN